jgi:hypothetical protein
MADAPLMGKGRQDHGREEPRRSEDRLVLQEDDYYDDADDAAELEPIPMPARAPDTGAGIFVWALTFAAGISGLLFGCKSSLSTLPADNGMRPPVPPC